MKNAPPTTSREASRWVVGICTDGKQYHYV